MSGKIQLPIDLKELCNAFEDSSNDHSYYLDLETGGITLDFLDAAEREELNEMEDEASKERYRFLPDAESKVGYKEMKEFIETVKGAKLKEKLRIAIARSGAFKRFKNVLNFYPNEEERWFKFKDDMVMGRVNEWLEKEGIEIIPQKPIEIREISPREISESKEIEESWKGFCARGCLECDNEEEFNERYFVISRCPDSEEEEHWLDETLKKKFGLKHNGITAGIFNDNRGLINSAVCVKCGSHDIFFDF
jgi:DNA polymerase III alpha subunit